MPWWGRVGSRVGEIAAVVVVVSDVFGAECWRGCGVWWACCAPLFVYFMRRRPALPAGLSECLGMNGA